MSAVRFASRHCSRPQAHADRLEEDAVMRAVTER